MEYIAILCCGLPTDSRTIKEINKKDFTLQEILLANIADRLSLIWWSKTKDGQKNRNKPQMITEIMMPSEKPKAPHMVFDSADDFEAMRRKIIEEKVNG